MDQTAALGSSIEVPTPDGESVRLKVPAGTLVHEYA